MTVKKLNFFQKIFSINNSQDKRHKIIMFFGIKLKLKKDIESSQIKIFFYNCYRKKRIADTVCYTCITGNYDNIIQHKYINKNWDYVCFTDNKEWLKRKRVGIWAIKPLEYSKESNSLNNRWHKFFPHKIFKNYINTVYIDGNINILTNYLSDKVSKTDKFLLLPKHFKNNCIYEELDFIVECKKDTAQNIDKIRHLYEKENMPKNIGFAENNVIFRRLDNDLLPKMMEEWWNFLHKYSQRDQASLSYILWKNGFKISDFNHLSNTRDIHNGFFVVEHGEKE